MTRFANVPEADSAPKGAPERDIDPSAARPRTQDSGTGPSVAGIGDRFRLLEKLGQGGMGVVHRAFDSERGCEVALKVIDVSRPDDLYRLKREFRFLAD